MPYRIIDRLANRVENHAQLVDSLRAAQASIAPKYFYDNLGCALFSAICHLPEYYPTRTERAIFHEYRAEIAEAMGQQKQFVDLGAGDCCKAWSWLAFIEPARYIAVDIAGEQLAKSLAAMAPEFPDLEMVAIVTDFSQGLELFSDLQAAPVSFFYPGSSIGNFTPEQAVDFLRNVKRHCEFPGSGLLIGVDSKKNPARLSAAYDDSLGVTAAFNRNILQHVNRLIGVDFHIQGFAHHAFYNETKGRVEMHLRALHEQTVTIADSKRVFAQGESIHTENSYKYAPNEFTDLLRQAGFARITFWQDGNKDFTVFYAE